MATRASESVEFAQLVLVAPGFRRIAEHGMGEAPDPDDPNLGSPGRHTTANTLIMHGDLDEIVPLADSIAWATAREVPVVVVPGGEHFFHRKLHVLREIVARWISDPHPDPLRIELGRRDGASVVRARGIRKSYGGREVVAGLDLELARGECFGLLGPNGAGKTTTLRCCWA